MADITASDVTITMDIRDVGFTQDDLLRSYPTITFGDGILTYPANGVPLPTKNKLGLRLGYEVKRMYISPPTDGYDYRYDYTNHTIRIFKCADGLPMAEISGAITAVTLRLEILGR